MNDGDMAVPFMFGVFLALIVTALCFRVNEYVRGKECIARWEYATTTQEVYGMYTGHPECAPYRWGESK